MTKLQLRFKPICHLSTQMADSSAFLEFILSVVFETLTDNSAENIKETQHVKALVFVLFKALTPLSRTDIQTAVKLKDRETFRARFLKPAIEACFIEITIPNKPNCHLQAYNRLTN